LSLPWITFQIILCRCFFRVFSPRCYLIDSGLEDCSLPPLHFATPTIPSVSLNVCIGSFSSVRPLSPFKILHILSLYLFDPFPVCVVIPHPPPIPSLKFDFLSLPPQFFPPPPPLGAGVPSPYRPLLKTPLPKSSPPDVCYPHLMVNTGSTIDPSFFFFFSLNHPLCRIISLSKKSAPPGPIIPLVEIRMKDHEVPPSTHMFPLDVALANLPSPPITESRSSLGESSVSPLLPPHPLFLSLIRLVNYFPGPVTPSPLLTQNCVLPCCI